MLCLYSCCNDKSERKSPEGPDSTGKHMSSIRVLKIDTAAVKISTDSNELKKVLNFHFFRPSRVQFLLAEADSSSVMNNSPRMRLEAVLYFDTASFERIMYNYISSDMVYPEYSRAEFEFDWLDNNIQKELRYSPAHYSGHPDFFFTYPADSNAHLWILENKILIHYYRN